MSGIRQIIFSDRFPNNNTFLELKKNLFYLDDVMTV